MSLHLTLSQNQLARLIGAFAFPDPDGDFDPRGPGGPRLRTLALARHAVRSAVAWADGLGEHGEVARLIVKGPPTQAGGGPDPGARPDADAPADADPGREGGGDDAQTDGVIVKGPPTHAMRLIAPSIRRFVDDFCGSGPIRLPVPIRWPWPWPPGPGPDPWLLDLEDERLRAAALLLAGAEFAFAAAGQRVESLRELFRAASGRLLQAGLARLERGEAAPAARRSVG